MKNHACKKFVCLLCAVLLLAAAVVPAYADDDSISVSSNPVTDGKTCSSCGLKSMVPTGATRTEKTQVYMTACPNTGYATTPHYHSIETTYATYVCTNCGSWGEMVISRTNTCPIL